MSRLPKAKDNHYRPHNLPDGQRSNRSHANAARVVEGLQALPLDHKKAAIRKILIENHIADVSKNDSDPFGNGDQTSIEAREARDIARHLFATGGDIHEHFIQPDAVSKLSFACATGSLSTVQQILSRAIKNSRQPHSKNDALSALFEVRETSMRLPPLMLVVAMGKNFQTPSQPNVVLQHREVAKLLLKHGASPISRDIVGKTVAHYGAGGMANHMTMDIVGACIHAAKSHHLYGQDVELHNLKKVEMNGKTGVAGGYDADLRRRSVYLPDEDKEVLIKVENMKLVECAASPYPPLADMQCRLGSVPLHELVMGRNFTGNPKPPGWPEQDEIGAFLLLEHHASIHIDDPDGISPFRMASGMGQLLGDQGVAKLVMEKARNDARESTKARKKIDLSCWNCGVELSKDAPRCARCHTARYCKRDCQLAHWKDHKKRCKVLAVYSSGTKLDSPEIMLTAGYATTTSFQTGNISRGGNYQKPRNVAYDKKFVVKTQAAGDAAPIVVYDQTRECMFDLYPKNKGFSKILAEVQSEPAWQGRKTFMKASFDENGFCTLYPDKAGVKAHYTW